MEEGHQAHLAGLARVLYDACRLSTCQEATRTCWSSSGSTALWRTAARMRNLGHFGQFFIYTFGAKKFQRTAGCARMRIYRTALDCLLNADEVLLGILLMPRLPIHLLKPYERIYQFETAAEYFFYSIRCTANPNEIKKNLFSSLTHRDRRFIMPVGAEQNDT